MTAQRVGYVVSRFPKTTETFIVREMQAVERNGWQIELFAIKREHGQILQPGASAYLSRLVAISDLGVRRIVSSQWSLLRADRRRWFRLWRRAIGGNLRSPKALARAIVVAAGTPAVAAEAERMQLRHLHAHWGTHSALLAHLVSLLTGIPYSVTLHAHDLHVARTMLGTKLREAAGVVTISQHNAELLGDLYPDVGQRVEVVHCGIDTRTILRRIDTDPAPELESEIQLVCVAGLRPFKGHRYLLDAIAELQRRGRRVRCDLIGDGPERERLQRLAPAGVTFHGAVDVGQALEIVATADVFVMPSVEMVDGRRDGIPVALMEAMAIGVPVVASDVSGIPELVHGGSTGLLVPPGDALGLADAIERLIDDRSLRDQLTDAGRRLIEQEFDLETTGRAMARIFQSSGGVPDPASSRSDVGGTAPASHRRST